jgi:pimeloyl-ACP methyl ester carboxylesterase
VRQRRDEELAQRIMSVGVEEFLVEWTRQPLFAATRLSFDEQSSRLVNTADGLASSLVLSGTGTQEWLTPQLTHLSMPCTFMAGATDFRFSRHAQSLASSVGGHWVTVAGAGHAAHLDQPALTAALVRRALA